jgi:hypothetical protein
MGALRGRKLGRAFCALQSRAVRTIILLPRLYFVNFLLSFEAMFEL